MINELKLYDFQGIIPLPNESMDHYKKRAQKTQVLMKEFYHLIKSSVKNQDYRNLNLSLSENPRIEFLDSVAIPEYGFGNPMHPIVSLDKSSFRKNYGEDFLGICERIKYKGTKLPLILVREDKVEIKKHEEFHGMRAPFEKNRLHPSHITSSFYEEYLASLLNLSEEFVLPEYLSTRNYYIKRALPLTIALGTLTAIARLTTPFSVYDVILGLLLYSLGICEYSTKKIKKITPSIENIQTSKDKSILPLLARITHNELISISNEVSGGKSLGEIIEEKENDKYGYRWKIIHDRL